MSKEVVIIFFIHERDLYQHMNLQLSMQNYRPKESNSIQYSSYANISKFGPENDYYDKETLYFQIKSLKEEMNIIRAENIKLKTRILQQDKELQNFEKYIEELQFKPNSLAKNNEYIIQQIKKQNKDLQLQLQEKLCQIEQMKKNTKVIVNIFISILFQENDTKVQELKIENSLYKEEINKLKKILQDQEKSTQEFINQQSMIKDNFIRTQQGFIKQQLEISDLKQKQQNDNLKITQLQNEVSKLNQIKVNLEDKIQRISTEQNKKTSTNSFKSNKFQATTEISYTQLRSKTQEELQYKLIIRGIVQMIQKQAFLIGQKMSNKLNILDFLNIQEFFCYIQIKQNKNLVSANVEYQNQLLIQVQLYIFKISNIYPKYNITYEQFTQMIQELKQQAIDQKKQIEIEDIEYILSQEPFTLGQDRIQEVVKSLQAYGNKLADSLLNQIGKYKTFLDYPDFKIEEAEKMIKQTLKQPEIAEYVQKKQVQLWNKEEVVQMVKYLKITWNESVLLFYLLNLFEKSGQILEFKSNTIIDPFPQLVQKESSRIIEESDEDLFDQQSDPSQNMIIQDDDHYIA